ncbi:hypothetical protein CV102_08455 [Natronococcus pandeyae]|uniref:Uncharacterized protein n=1 Tax=Natronococcus pandeyae TaxID=2055836 RepID=A0A8J8Q662_9EURY|nr:hypothetical protein [Natronococcus pandeyae]TYL39298.1 hypothetical protein CV102_08455 [Natronococcus pandeyae]
MIDLVQTQDDPVRIPVQCVPDPLEDAIEAFVGALCLVGVFKQDLVSGAEDRPALVEACVFDGAFVVLGSDLSLAVLRGEGLGSPRGP